MQRVQANVDRLKVEYIEEKRLQKEQQQAELADIGRGDGGRQRGTGQGTGAPAALGQGPGSKREDAVMEEMRALGSARVGAGAEGLTVGELEKREIELKRREFGKLGAQVGCVVPQPRNSRLGITMICAATDPTLPLLVPAAEQAKQSSATGNPSDGFKPEAWTPTSAPRRR